jgi:hypothetical protein
MRVPGVRASSRALCFGLLAVWCCFAQTTKRSQLPKRYRALVIRTDFDYQRAWQAAARAIQAPWKLPNGQTYSAEFNFLEDSRLRDASERDVLKPVPKDYAQDFVLVVDRDALSRPEFPILVVSVSHEEQYGRSFRAIAAEIPIIEASLFIANMDFRDFADAVDHDGMFRGFPEPR